MVQSIDVFIGYRTNPHLDMRKRGAEAASAIREMLGGVKPQRAFIRLPIVPPTVTMLTAAGPYAEMIDFGQRRMTPEIMNVSVMGGFAFADTAKNGLTVVVTARHDRPAAERLAGEIAELGWANRQRFYPRLTSLEEAVEKALAVGRNFSLPPLAFADVADNPGGGGRGNTTFLLRAFHEAGVAGALLGVFFDPDLAAEAHSHGVGASFGARFNRSETTKFSEPYTAPATVVALTDGKCVGRRGIYAGLRLELGPCAALQVGRGDCRRDLASRAMRRSDLLRNDEARHRSRALCRGEIARAFPRRLRRVLWTGPDRRSRPPRTHLADAEPLRMAAPAPPGHPARRQCRMGQTLTAATGDFAWGWTLEQASMSMLINKRS